MNEVFENNIYLNCFLIQVDREKTDGSDIGLNCTPENFMLDCLWILDKQIKARPTRCNK